MAKRQAQAKNPTRGLRWTIEVDGRPRIFWGATAEAATAAARLAHPGAILSPPRPAPPDHRNVPRGAAKTKRLSIAVTEEQLSAIHALAAAAGQTMADYVLGKALEGSEARRP